MPVLTDNLCYNCFTPQESPEGPCPYCGFDLAENVKKFPVALRAGTVLGDRYIVGRVLGQGGFGITYLAFDTQLQAKVAVKEYMPNDIATRIGGTTVSVAMATKADDFTYGAERFQEEARTLAKFIGHPNVAGVSSYFDENDTSYFVMDYIEGISFKNYIANAGGKVSVDEVLNVMIPVLRALTAVHAEGFIHRDVTPDNIYISKDGNVKLLDFGSARYSIGDKSKSLDVILKVGYAPKEQYTRRGRQGPYTDVYSCAACFYAALTGVLPPESLERLEEDTLVPVSQAGIDIPDWLDRAILKGLAVQPEDRFQSAAEFLDAIENQLLVDVPGAAPAAAQPAQKKSKAPVIAAVAALLAVAVGLGLFFGGRQSGGEAPVMNEPAMGTVEQRPPLKKAEVPSITIQGEEYSTDLTSLELYGKGLTDEDIADLKYMINLTYLNLNGNNLTDISPLSALTELRQLNVNNNVDLADFSPLSGLTELQMINNYGCPVTDYSFVTGLTKLESIQLYNVQEDTDLSPLSGLTNLKNLSCGGDDNYITDLSFLSGMTGLQGLSLIAFGDIDISFAANMPELTNLQIYCYSRNGQSYAEVRDLSPLAGLTKLQNLSLPVNVPDLDALSGMTDLRNLQLTYYGNNAERSLTDIGGLSGMTKLTVLELEMGDVKDLSPLSELTELTDLTLRGNFRPADLGFLSGMAKLRTLRLNFYNNDGTSIFTSLKGLENLTELRELRLYGTARLTDVEPLRNLTKLTTLELQSWDTSENPAVFDLSGLSGLTELQDLTVQGNFTSLEPLRSLTKLQNLYVSGSFTTLEPLRDLTGLRSLRIEGRDRQHPLDSLEPLSGMEKLSSLYIGPVLTGTDQSPVEHVKERNINEYTPY